MLLRPASFPTEIKCTTIRGRKANGRELKHFPTLRLCGNVDREDAKIGIAVMDKI